MNILIILPDRNDPQNLFVTGLRKQFPQAEVNRVERYGDAGALLRNADILMTFGALLTDEVFSDARRLKWIQILGAGFDGIFSRPGFRPEIMVSNASDMTATPVAEAAIASLFALTRDLPRVLRNQGEKQWVRFPARLLSGQKLLIVGSGAAAAALAKRAQVLEMDTVGVSRTPRKIRGFNIVVPREQLIQQARTADNLVVLSSLDPSSRGLVSAQVIDALPNHACFIDVSRGGVTDLAALTRRLHAGTLRGAAVDVFPQEPLPADDPLWDTPGLILSPHIAGLNDSYAATMLPFLVRNVEAFAVGRAEDMRNIVTQQPVNERCPRRGS